MMKNADLPYSCKQHSQFVIVKFLLAKINKRSQELAKNFHSLFCEGLVI